MSNRLAEMREASSVFCLMATRSQDSHLLEIAYMVKEYVNACERAVDKNEALPQIVYLDAIVRELENYAKSGKS